MTQFNGANYTNKPLVGTTTVPGDKSISHRIALFAACAEGTTRVRGLLNSADVRSTLDAVVALGAQVDLTEDADFPDTLCGTITGWGKAGPAQPAQAIDCGNSGTTARLLMGLLAGYPLRVELVGDESLSRRPMRRVAEPLTQMGARFESASKLAGKSISKPTGKPTDKQESPELTLPLVVHGSSELRGIHYDSPVASAQVKSAVLLAGLNAQGATSVTEPRLSRTHTELLLPSFGVELERRDYGRTTLIEGGQHLQACEAELQVPSDPSSAAFLLIAAALTSSSELTVQGVSLNPTRTGFLSIMRRMGVKIAIKNSNLENEEEVPALSFESRGTITAFYSPELQGTTIEAGEIPSLIDEIPILALLATAAQGTTRFREVGELRVKETDRLAAIVEGLTTLGFIAYAEENDLVIEGDGTILSHRSSAASHSSSLTKPNKNVTKSYRPLKARIALATHNDHRLAMTWLVAARAFALNLDIDGLESLTVSYPSFLKDLERLGSL
ncbi:MAG: 3-phosphoshikimate 1-carboxyvinyltransferase [Coriobacteriales bacterium]|jgi:3-phosphoshikimate 1-carboxyvinyltransferase|nr:3-phosphoshikimate 1-carboxyvinyltransferase [Coriobacteriales bacterium]